MPVQAKGTLLIVQNASDSSSGEPALQEDKVNLALRRTADKLLRAAGDSTSRIPAVEKINDHTWRIHLDESFQYDLLPPILQASLDRYEIHRAYEVTVRQCESSLIDLGYHQRDFLRDSMVPCGGREAPPGCHYIQITFQEKGERMPFWWAGGGLLLIIAGSLWLRRKHSPEMNIPLANSDQDWLDFGKSRLHLTGQVLECAGVRHSLTYREAKLLRLFASRPGELLERDEILRQVWEDEGVQVGRSVDVFVSRLRKKLAGDPGIGIVAVHGIGYRMEVREK